MQLKNMKRGFNRRGISNVLGYVLLIGIVIVLSGIIFVWLKTYVPNDNVLECPDSVSVMLKDVSCSPENGLTFKLKNNGLFDVEGYIIKAKTSENQELATANLNSTLKGNTFLNDFFPGEETEEQKILHDIPIYAIEITPILFQEDEQGNDRVVLCGNAKVKQTFDEVCETV